MLLDTLPRHGPVSDPGTGEERRVAVALLLMNDPADDGLTTGWYWTEVPNDPKPEDLKSKQRWARRRRQRAGTGPRRGRRVRRRREPHPRKAGRWPPA